MKKFLSLLLSLVMLLSISTGMSITAQAAGWADTAIKVQFDTVYTAEPSTLDAGEHINDMGVTIDRYFDAFKFTVPVKGKVTLNMDAASKYYLPLNYESRIDYLIYSDKNIDEALNIDYTIVNSGFSSARNMYYGEYAWTLPAGTYYVVFEYNYNSFWGFDQEGSCEFSLSYIPSLALPSKLKVSARNTTSLKLGWNKVSGVSGYQLQQYKGNKWTTVKNTTSNTYTVSKLKAGTTYKFRVRAYKKVSGKNYYSGWAYLTAPTKPATVTLSSVKSTKSKKITVKWKKATCTGYQVQYSTSSKFKKGNKTITVSNSKTTSKTISKLKGKKKYYVRIRAYKTVDGKKYYGSWSKVKSVTTKK